MLVVCALNCQPVPTLVSEGTVTSASVRCASKQETSLSLSVAMETVDHGSLRVLFSQGHAADVFEAYTQLLTEMVLRLPYQIKKIADTSSRIPPPVFDHSWFYFLSEVSGGSSTC